MEIRKIKLEDLDSVFELLNELYENKIEYSKFTQKYKESLEDSSFYGIVAIENNKVVGVQHSCGGSPKVKNCSLYISI